jgi:hypothetical protein
MKFNINKLTTNTQTQVIFDKMLTLNKVEFESANQLKIGLGEQTLNGKMVQKLATTLANTANQFNLKALFLPVLISEIEASS